MLSARARYLYYIIHVNAAEIGALRAENATMLACGRRLEHSNNDLKRRLTTAEVGLIQASAVASGMAHEGMALESRLKKAEAEAEKVNLRLSTVMAMTRAKVRVLPWS